MPAYFSEGTWRFFRALARNNNRTWFHAHKPDYERHVREPYQRLLEDLRPAVAEISAHYHANPARAGGSLFRINRDTRFANDKSPYKTWQGAKIYHTRHRQLEAPSFHLHLRPGQSFVGAGLWRPHNDTVRKVRQFILDNPASWKAAAHDAGVRERFALDDRNMLVRMPHGFPADFEFAADLRRKGFVLMRPLDDSAMTGPGLLALLEEDFAALARFTDYLCAAVDLEF
ncbi:TIGR02453 family protein [Lysobacter sp. GX 14042]|uniref:DUF2461 domain-containing protein n=1 Tax=Lysobacter sp. GX 14042 TaxID=2907155 RepID=UPI001F1E4A71|nr:TIGR02453 family protein [Lysobacter sp. GX 14042]MCE7031277.1 TIGR02453 family protein [Lysobacter sp. GX 14042]